MNLGPGTIVGYGISKLAPGLVTLASVPLSVHVLGAASYGVYSSTWAVTLLATSIFGGWLRAAALRATGDPARALELIPRWVLVLSSLAPAGPSLCWVLVLESSDPSIGSTGLLAAAALFGAVNGVYVLVTTRTQRDGSAARFAAAETTRSVVGLLATVILGTVNVEQGAAAILNGYTVGTVAAGLVALAGHWPSLKQTSTNRGLLTTYWKYGWPMSLWLATSTALVYVDRLVVTQVVGATAAGHYAAAADIIVRGTAVVASPLIMAVHPVLMSGWDNGDVRDALKLLRTTMWTMVVLLSCAVAAVGLIGPALVHHFIPSAGLPRQLLVGLAVGSAMWQLGIVAHKPFELVSRSVQMLAMAAAAASMTILLDLALVPRVGVMGAVLALCIGATAYTLVCALQGARLLRSRPPSGKGFLSFSMSARPSQR